MGNEALNLQQKAELTFLRNEVNKREFEVNLVVPHPNVQQDLLRARKELKDYTSSLRKSGINI
jgi:hypothetical protein|tara:strand:- start:1114 stop:1302 length:189 start_codon:yes stop_codon:yes gene_type:complete